MIHSPSSTLLSFVPNSFIPSLNINILSIPYEPGEILGTGELVVNGNNHSSSLESLHVRWEIQTVKT